MRSRGVRVLLFLLALAVLAAAGAGVWQFEQRIARLQAAADSFERAVRQAAVSLGDWRAAQQAYVAEGQPPEAWMTRAAVLAQDLGPRLAALRGSAGSAEAQGALEVAIEAFGSALQNDAKARDYVKSGQHLSASDVIFVSVAPALERAAIGLDTARGQEQVAFAVAVEDLRRWELIALGSAAGVLLVVLLLLVPIPRSKESAAAPADEEAAADGDSILPLPRGLSLSQDFDDDASRARPAGEAAPAPVPTPTPTPTLTPAPKPGPVSAPEAAATAAVAAAAEMDSLGPIDLSLDERASARTPDLDAVADLCTSLARVQDTRELQGLLERIAKSLDASGVVVWMPDVQQGNLRPVLAHGYTPVALSRMGTVHPAADNATATAYRTRSIVVVDGEFLASAAIVAPLISSEGCSGVIAVELREGIDPTPQDRAVATILAAQLATMFTPVAISSARPTPPVAGSPHRPDEAAGRF
jgi:hypothetical protein